MTEVDFAKVSELKENDVTIRRFGRKRVAVCQFEGNYYAFADVCTHDNGPIGEGQLCGREIECPRHGARFDITTGAITAPPAFAPLKTYPIRLAGDTLKVNLE